MVAVGAGAGRGAAVVDGEVGVGPGAAAVVGVEVRVDAGVTGGVAAPAGTVMYRRFTTMICRRGAGAAGTLVGRTSV